MGWITCYSASFYKMVNGKRVVDRQKECDKLFTYIPPKNQGEESTNSIRVLKSTMVGRVYYAAVERCIYQDDKVKNRAVSAVVVLTCGKGRDGTIWGYKEMDETMGPNESKCPMAILNLLTPALNEYAKQWRERCIEYHRGKNKPESIIIPTGISVEAKRCSWLLSSANYCMRTIYTKARYSKKVWHTLENAILHFVSTYGTEEQKKEIIRGNT